MGVKWPRYNEGGVEFHKARELKVGPGPFVTSGYISPVYVWPVKGAVNYAVQFDF